MTTLESQIARLHAIVPEIHARTRRWVEVNSFTANVPAATPLGTLQNSATVVYDDPTRTTAGMPCGGIGAMPGAVVGTIVMRDTK